jgi:molybdopterin/thiamine biosynthesis adenylyltransferase
MTTITVALAEAHWQELVDSLSDQRETAAVLLAGVAEDGGRLVVTINRILWVPDDAYEHRDQRQLRIASAGWMPALKHAATGQWCPVFLHTHPHSDPTPSTRDDRVDEALRNVFQMRGNSRRYVSLVLGVAEGKPTLSGRVYERHLPATPVTRVRIAGPQLRVQRAFGDDDQPEAPIELDPYDRQIRAFGEAGQRILRDLRIGIVGCGGTGSSVSEQLTRLGVGSLVLIDDDIVTTTNVTRIYGSTRSDVNRPKVEVLHDYLTGIGLGTHVEHHKARITHRTAMEHLRGCDLVFGCTDNHSSRTILSRLAYWYLIPVIDMAVVVKSADEEIVGIYGRVAVAAPGEPCLLCRGEVDARRATEERYSDAERNRLIQEGYAEGLDNPDPAVIAYTTMTASHAVADFLQRLFGFRTSSLSGKYRLQISDKTIGRPASAIRDGCYCAPTTNWGRADHEPPLDMMWPE